MEDKRQEHIDQFITQVLNQPDIPYQEEHWNALESMLDSEMPQIPPSDSGPYYFSANTISLLIGAAMVWLLFTSGNGTDRSVGDLPVTGAVSDAPMPLPESSSESINQTSDELAVITPEPNRSAPAANQAAAHPEENRDQQPALIQLNQRAGPGNDQQADESVSGQEQTEQKVKNETPIINEKTGDETERSEQTREDPPEIIRPITPLLTEATDEPVVNNSKTVTGEEGYVFVIQRIDTIMIAETGSVFRPVEMELEEDRAIPTQKKNAFYVGLTLAPDLNSVGFINRTKISALGGLLVEYIRDDHWIISSGILINKKKYITSGENYHPPAGYWGLRTNGVVPDEIDGYCTVIDVPLNIGYKGSFSKKLDWMVKVGLSNYFLLNEGYEFTYFNPNPGAAENWQSSSDASVYAGIANASFGIEWEMLSGLNVRVEPYLKVPVRDIGWGQIELFSTGAFISVIYELRKRK